MSRPLTIEIPDDVDQALHDEATRTGVSPEEVVLAWMREHVSSPSRGSVDAVMPYFGTWSMSPDERQRIEQMIAEERLLEDEHD